MLTDTLLRNAKPKDKPYKLPKEFGLGLIVNPLPAACPFRACKADKAHPPR
jgi:hypothetical protein